MDNNKKLSNIFGFTLIELMVSIFIIGLVSGIFMVNYHNTGKRTELKMAAQKLASDIRLAQNYSLGSKTYNGTDTPSGGWGVHLRMNDDSHYIIFADKAENGFPNGDKIYDQGEAVETRTLPADITISSLDGNNRLSVVFFPPDPATIINGSYNSSTIIRLKENINNSTVEVTVNSFGLIDTQ